MLGKSSAPIVHIVITKYHPQVSQSERHLLATKMLALRHTCVLDGKPYILSLSGGKNKNPEGYDHGFEVLLPPYHLTLERSICFPGQHAFVMTFATFADREYYLHEDPVHLEFKTELLLKVASACVMDYEPGVF